MCMDNTLEWPTHSSRSKHCVFVLWQVFAAAHTRLSRDIFSAYWIGLFKLHMHQFLEVSFILAYELKMCLQHLAVQMF